MFASSQGMSGMNGMSGMGGTGSSQGKGGISSLITSLLGPVVKLFSGGGGGGKGMGNASTMGGPDAASLAGVQNYLGTPATTATTPSYGSSIDSDLGYSATTGGSAGQLLGSQQLGYDSAGFSPWASSGAATSDDSPFSSLGAAFSDPGLAGSGVTFPQIDSLFG